MKIAQFDDSYFPIYDGVAVVVDNYTSILKERGHEAFVVTINNKEAKDNFTYPVYRFLSSWNPFNKIYQTPLVPFDFKLKKHLEKMPIDIIHAHSPFMVGHYALRLAKKRKIPIIATFHTKFYDDLVESMHSKILAKMTLKYIIRWFNKCDYVIAVSSYAKKLLYEYGYQGDIIVIPHGVEFKMPTNKNMRIKSIREEYNIKSEEELLFFVGQHNYKKNIKLIYEALAIYKEKQPNVKLLMVGRGCHEKELKRYGESLGLEKHIIYAGKISDRDKLTSMYLASDLFVFPSTYDTISLVVREAAFCEVPSVVVKDFGPSEGITHNENGFLCENNKESLAKEIENALSDKKRLKQIGKAASQTLPLTWDKILDEVEALYKKILKP